MKKLLSIRNLLAFAIFAFFSNVVLAENYIIYWIKFNETEETVDLVVSEERLILGGVISNKKLNEKGKTWKNIGPEGKDLSVDFGSLPESAIEAIRAAFGSKISSIKVILGLVSRTDRDSRIELMPERILGSEVYRVREGVAFDRRTDYTIKAYRAKATLE
ncbi:MAG: hypothetical protein LBP39_02960 [Rickettsiales bacterium]|jgi:hypothetical protein|nr:hypothetical protein [Rickettsiales bacterium]